eukprot:gene41891-56732_t
MSVFTPPVVILDRSQMAENIGAVARVMANFGLDRLRLVSPRDGWPQERAWAMASGADWVLDGVEVFDSVAAAERPTVSPEALDVDKLRRRLDGDEETLRQLALAMRSDLVSRLTDMHR